MSHPIDSRTLHDRDWEDNKPDFAFFEKSPRYPFIADLVVELATGSIFDLGCGSGFLAKLIKDKLPEVEVHGVDISRAALSQAEHHLDKVWQADIDHENLPVNDNSYNVVTCVEVLEHLYDPQHALSEVNRILSPGGFAMITVPNLAFWRYRADLMLGRVPNPAADQRHLQQFNRQIFTWLLEEAQLRTARVLGFRQRIQELARWKPEWFSDILVAVVEKPKLAAEREVGENGRA